MYRPIRTYSPPAPRVPKGQDVHPGRECSPDCAEFGCASWTACQPRPVRGLRIA